MSDTIDRMVERYELLDAARLIDARAKAKLMSGVVGAASRHPAWCAATVHLAATNGNCHEQQTKRLPQSPALQGGISGTGWQEVLRRCKNVRHQVAAARQH